MRAGCSDVVARDVGCSDDEDDEDDGDGPAVTMMMVLVVMVVAMTAMVVVPRCRMAYRNATLLRHCQRGWPSSAAG